MRQVVAGVSLVYDLTAGLALLFATGTFAGWFGVPVPDPVIFVKLTAIFLIAVGLGYVSPLRDPEAHRYYLWIFGVFLKSAGALTFIVSYLSGGSPASFLLFTLTDGGLAAWTFMALKQTDEMLIEPKASPVQKASP